MTCFFNPRLFVSLASVGLFIDTIAPLPTSLVDAAGRLSLDAVLVAGVLALWRELRAERARVESKDTQVVQMAVEASKMGALMTRGFEELRSSIEELRDNMPEHHGKPNERR